MSEMMKWNVVGAVGRTQVAWNSILELLLFITLSPKYALAKKNSLMRKQKTHKRWLERAGGSSGLPK
jgi:hypothetical protein